MLREPDQNVVQWIAKIDSSIKTNRPDYYADLLPGATLAEINELEAKFGISLPEAFKLFLTWKNGQDKNNFDNFFANFGLMSVAKIASKFEMLNELADGGEFELANWWVKGWLPFLQNYAGDHYCIDLVGSFGGQPGQIIIFWHDWEARTIGFKSFEDFLRTVSTALETLGFATVHEDLSEDKKLDDLIEELNPGYPKWHDAG